eukprot:2898981-Pleurochrysis_carterae.AAC.1
MPLRRRLSSCLSEALPTRYLRPGLAAVAAHAAACGGCLAVALVSDDATEDELRDAFADGDEAQLAPEIASEIEMAPGMASTG